MKIGKIALNLSISIGVVFVICTIAILGLIIVISYPSYVSIQERAFNRKELPDSFAIFSSRYTINNKPIVLNYRYENQLFNEYESFSDNYRFSRFVFRKIQKDFLLILNDVLKNELSNDSNVFDTVYLFNKIHAAINEKLKGKK